MKIAFFYHSLVSDWNHGNAHFLRGIAAELIARGHSVCIHVPEDGWSITRLRLHQGNGPIAEFYRIFSQLEDKPYGAVGPDLEQELADVDLVLVHEWTSHDLVQRIGDYRKEHTHFKLLFHDTHHRAFSDPDNMAAFDFSGYDGVLAYGESLCRIYLEKGWMKQAWTWHEAADIRVFQPFPRTAGPIGDVVWIGNWGDEERTAEYHEFLIEPVQALKLKARVYGVQYPEKAVNLLRKAGIEYLGWLPNYKVPAVFSRYRVTLHIPRRPYVAALKGIPTIRPFEAMACGIPLICTPWEDTENLFSPGQDYLVAENGRAMRQCLRMILKNHSIARKLSEHSRKTILERHTCAHRVDELFAVYQELDSTKSIAPQKNRYSGVLDFTKKRIKLTN